MTPDARRLEDGDNTLGSEIHQPSHDPIDMSKPYIFLNCSQFDEKEARASARVLRDLGYQVWLDETIFQGKLWSEERSNAIEGCDLLFELNCEKSKYISYIRETANEFAKHLGITRIIAQEKEIYRIANDNKQFVITTRVTDEDFSERCHDALKLAGLKTDVVKTEKPLAEKQDLVLEYYKNYLDQDRGWVSQRIRYCNLRTREVYDWQFKQVPRADKPYIVLLGNEDVYRAMVWKKCGYRTFLKSKSVRREYEENEVDHRFTKRLTACGGSPPPELIEEYRMRRERIKKARSGHPYMDEYEYINSKFDD